MFLPRLRHLTLIRRHVIVIINLTVEIGIGCSKSVLGIHCGFFEDGVNALGARDV
jgi:hypothetical protein